MENIINQGATQRKKIHPHKFAMWVAMGSISMMFAGLTSAYVVREGQNNWRNFDLPWPFTASTVIILLSSITMILGIKAFKKREMQKYKSLMLLTILLGLLFGGLQYLGFYQLYHVYQPIKISGQVLNDTAPVRIDGNPSESFVFIIAGLHLLHILGGIIAMVIVYFRTLRKNVKVYDATGLEVAASYWHFVDILWIYLFIFFLAFN